MTRLPNTIETYSGHLFDYYAPVVCLEDVAHALSQTCRFGGHCTKFYSVSEHSVLVSRIVAGIDPNLALPALWHDAHEAYSCDIPTPLKKVIGEPLQEIVDLIDEACAGLLGIDVALFKHPIIKAADQLAIGYEASQLKTGNAWAYTKTVRHEQAEEAAWSNTLGLEPWEAKKVFILEHRTLVENG